MGLIWRLAGSQGRVQEVVLQWMRFESQCLRHGPTEMNPLCLLLPCWDGFCVLTSILKEWCCHSHGLQHPKGPFWVVQGRLNDESCYD